jgi:hypothetical protein
MQTTTVFSIRGLIAESVKVNHIAPEYLPIWSVVEQTTQTETQPSACDIIVTTEREVAIGLQLDQAYGVLENELVALARIGTDPILPRTSATSAA